MKKISVNLTAVAVVLCLIGVVLLTIFARPIADWYMAFRGLPARLGQVIAIAYYCCALPAAAALLCLLMLLMNIRKHDIFNVRNSRFMAVVSWCCLLITAICAIAAYWYVPLILVSALMLFLFLIVRVVRGCFVEATILREDQDLTI